jgi:hypothetical protein
VDSWQKIGYDLPERQPLYDGGRIVHEDHHRAANLAARNTIGVHIFTSLCLIAGGLIAPEQPTQPRLLSPRYTNTQHARLSEPLDALVVRRARTETRSSIGARRETPRSHWPFPFSQTLLFGGAALLYATLRYRRDIEERAKIDFYLEHVIYTNPAAYLYPITKPEER